jgi:hypothetical protein
MTLVAIRALAQRCALTALSTASIALTLLLFTATGTHGHGDHSLDVPANGTVKPAPPAAETSTELFELVATLHDDELSLIIDRYDTNEPVINAKVEVELGDLTAVAKYHEDHGDYAIDDPAILKRLKTPGEHALAFTVKAGDDTDLLTATLLVETPKLDAHAAHSHGKTAWVLGGVGLLVIATSIVLWRRRRSHTRMLKSRDLSEMRL